MFEVVLFRAEQDGKSMVIRSQCCKCYVAACTTNYFTEAAEVQAKARRCVEDACSIDSRW